MSSSQKSTSTPCVILGVCGGIAAYKLCELASHLTQQGLDVHAVMTPSATRFVAPLTFQALTQNPVHLSLWPEEFSSESGVAAAMAHIDLAVRADAVLVAPATAETIARLAHGHADDLLSTLVLATQAPVLVAPAMNPQMLKHPATQRNLEALLEFGYNIIEPEVGRMACEHVGAGRLPTTEVLAARLREVLSAGVSTAEAGAVKTGKSLAGKKVLVTAGPTREALDPVRFISNRSSGKMGYALAEEAAARGAEVLLVSGPTNLETPLQVERIDVIDTRQMFKAVQKHGENSDIIIAAAAPADFSPAKFNTQKIKKSGGTAALHLELIPTPDIIASAAKNRKPHQLFIGFAAETGSNIAEAERKLQAKSLDAIVFNDVTEKGAGFDADTNRVTWISQQESLSWPLLSKREVAAKIFERIELLLTAKNG